MSAVRGNKMDLCTLSGDVVKDVHVESDVLVPEAARDLEEPGAALEILDDAESRGCLGGRLARWRRQRSRRYSVRLSY